MDKVKQVVRVLARRPRKEHPDMPRHQLCPMCHKKSKRDRKTITGAFYRCPNHGEFFILGREIST